MNDRDRKLLNYATPEKRTGDFWASVALTLLLGAILASVTLLLAGLAFLRLGIP